ncbi:hypothetical protein AVEN_92699-1 [Araneus ventricosus]|uniref:Uncharacterized protein n=1 Tax=Araneus ventricosus TaxID=182803 RepID=A0A4Y2HLX0_ARAVE|nr:hypothetical protein AVEN_92699-1 [Araneus ventricosus]
MRDDFEGVNFLAGKRTWKYKARKLGKKKGGKRGKKARRKKSFFSNEEPLLERLEELADDARKNRLKSSRRSAGYGNNGALTLAGPRR